MEGHAAMSLGNIPFVDEARLVVVLVVGVEEAFVGVDDEGTAEVVPGVVVESTV